MAASSTSRSSSVNSATTANEQRFNVGHEDASRACRSDQLAVRCERRLCVAQFGRGADICNGSDPPGRLTPDRPFKGGSGAPSVERQVLEVVRPYAPLPLDWTVVIEAAAQAAWANDSVQPSGDFA